VSKYAVFIIAIIVNMVTAILVTSVAAISIVYAPNTTTIQHTNYSKTTVISPIKRLNANIIIDAINTKIRSVYNSDKVR
jgi:hypothetical protein